MAQPLFGIVPAGLSVITSPSEAPSPTSFLYSIPPPQDASKQFSHIVVFLLPGIELPQGTAAAIYLVTPPAAGQTTPSSRFLGGVGPGKESAIFKISPNTAANAAPTVIGISVEEASSVGARVEEIRAAKPAASAAASTALVNTRGSSPSTLVLAQRIIQNAFNFLASYSEKVPGGNGNGPEVVPLRAFEEWWRKFEGRVRSDPTFLERAAE